MIGERPRADTTPQPIESDPLRRLYWLAFLVVLAAGFWLRVNRLADQSFWLDEGATFTFASMPVGEIIATTFSREPNPPLYYLLVHGWLAVAGSTEFAIRMLSVFVGVLGVGLTARLGRETGSAAVGVVASFVAAASPYLVLLSQEARMFTLLAAFATGCYVIVLRAVKRPSLPTLVALGVLLLATLYTHFYGVFVWLSVGCFVAVWIGQKRKRGQVGLLAPLAVSGLLYLPWISTALRSGAAESSWRPAADLTSIAIRSLAAFAHGGYLTSSLALWLQVLAVGLACLGILALARSRRTASALLLIIGMALPVIAVALVSQRQTIFVERYVIALAPLFYIAMASGLVLPFRRLPVVPVLTVIFLVAGSLIAIRSAWHDPSFAKEDFRTAAQFLERQAGPNDLIVLVAGYVEMPFRYYYDGPARVVPFSGSTEQVGESLDSLVNERQRVWLLLSHAEQVDPQNQVHQWLSERLPEATEAFPKGIRLYGYRAGYRLAELPASATPVARRFENGLELVGYQAENEIVPTDSRLHPPSNWLHVTLYWRADGPVASDFESSVRIVDGQGVWGDKLVRQNGIFKQYPIQDWRPGEIVVEDVDVNLNPITPPGRYELEVRLIDGSGATLDPANGTPAITQVEIVAE